MAAARVAFDDECADGRVLVRLKPEPIGGAPVAEGRVPTVTAAIPLPVVATTYVARELPRICSCGVDVRADLISPVLVDDREDVLVAEIHRNADVPQCVEIDPGIGLVARETRHVVGE